MSPLKARIGDQALPAVDPKRPLLVVDADEVLVHFAAPFERWLNGRGIAIGWISYSFDGNVYETATGRLVEKEEFWRHVDAFFDSEVDRLPPVPGAATALTLLRQDWQIVILTNVPLAHKERRIVHLAALGMDYPLLANQGGKGTVMRELTAGLDAPCAFVDDASSNHRSVAKHAPHVHRIHYVADSRLSSLAETPEGASLRADCWTGISRYLQGLIQDAPA